MSVLATGRMVKRRQETTRWTAPPSIVAVVLVIGLVLVGAGAVAVGERRDDLWFEAAKAGLQLGVVTVLGSLVGYALRYFETQDAETRRRRERDADEWRRLNEARLRVFRDVVDAYNRAKAVRRILRSLGVLIVDAPLSEAQAEGLRSQMLALNDAQLTLEAVKREVAESHLFRDPSRLQEYLRLAEEFLADVLTNWERHGGGIWAGATPEAVAWLDLARFAGPKKDHPEFRDKVATALDAFTRELHRELTAPEASS